MRYTNRFGMPASLYRACTTSNYDPRKSQPNVISLTALINPPLLQQLQKRHWDEAEEDVNSILPRLFGTALHSLVANAQKGKGIEMLVEERIYLSCDTFEVYNITGEEKGVAKQDWFNPDVYYVSMQWDFYEQLSETEGLLEDLKSASAWALVFDPKGKDGWEEQLNVEAYVLRKLGFPVSKLQNTLVYKDWRKKESLQGGSYPKAKFDVVPQRIWSDEQVEQYVRYRLRSHVPAIEMADNEIPICTETERWYKEGQYAIMKSGNVKSSKNFPENQKKEAYAFCEEKIRKDGPRYEMQFRPGENNRCEEWCSVKNICRFGKELK